MIFSTYIDLVGIAEPALSGAGEVVIYFDSGTKKLRMSVDGGAYADIA